MRRQPSRGPDGGASDPEFVELAFVVKPHGLDGGVWVDLNTDFPERLPEWGTLEVVGAWGARQARVERVYGITGGRAIVLLEGVEDREQAEGLRGSVLRIRRDEVPPAPDGSYYEFQIIGLRVVSADGRDLGRVRGIIRTGAHDVYETDRIMIPAVDVFVREIDLERGEIVVDDIDGLLE